MRRRVEGLFLATVVLAFFTIETESGEPRETPEVSFARAVQRVLGIAPSDAEVAKPLVDLMGRVGPHPADADFELASESVASVVTAFNHGADPDVVAGASLAATHIDSPSVFNFPRDWKYGSAEQHNALFHYLWRRAQQMKKASSPDSANFARGALIFAAGDSLIWTCAVDVVTGDNKVRHKRLAKAGVNMQLDLELSAEDLVSLDDGAGMELKRLFQERQRQSDELLEHKLIKFEMEFDKISDDPKATAPSYREALSSLEGCWPVVPPEPREEFCVVSSAWHLLNLARVNGQEEVASKVEMLIKDWHTKTPKPYMKRWLQEALERIEGAPGRRLPKETGLDVSDGALLEVGIPAEPIPKDGKATRGVHEKQ